MHGQRNQRQRHHDAGDALREIGGALQRHDQPAVIARRQHAEWCRDQHGQRRAAEAKTERGERRAGNSGKRRAHGRCGRRAVLRQPPQNGAERDCDGHQRQKQKPQRRDVAPAAQCVAGGGAAGAAAEPAIARPAADQLLGDQTKQAQQHQHHSQQRRLRAGKPGAIRRVDRGGERAKTQHGEGAELDQRVQRHQQHAAQQRRPQLRQDHAAENCGGALPQRARALFQRRVHLAQGGGDRQVDQRIIRHRDHQQRARQKPQARAAPDPPVAGGEGGHGGRHHHQHRPEPAARQIGPFHEPGGGGADHAAGNAGA